jgi:hypothetical protein
MNPEKTSMSQNSVDREKGMRQKEVSWTAA